MGKIGEDRDLPLVGGVVLPVEDRLGHRVEGDFLGKGDRVRLLQLAQLLHFGGRERGLDRSPTAEEVDLLDPGMAERLEGVIGDVRGGEFIDGTGEDPGHVHRHIAHADHRDPLGGEIEDMVPVVRVAVVPRHEFGGWVAPAQVLARDTHPAIGLGPGSEGDRVIELAEFLDREIPPDFDIAEEPDVRAGRHFVEASGHRLDLLVIGRHAEPDEAVGDRQPLKQVDGDRAVGLTGELVGQEEPGRAGTDDCDTKRRRHGLGNSNGVGMRRS